MKLQFKVEEADTDWQTYNVSRPIGKDIYEITEEAARIYFYGLAGWQQGWPLTFQVRTESGKPIVRAAVFILSGLPEFDVIPINQ